MTAPKPWIPKAQDFQTLKFLFWDLQAHNPEKQINRFYRVNVLQNLFGEWEILIHHGRVGTRGRTRTQVFSDLTLLPPKLAHILRRRLNAKSRLGVNYVIRKTNYGQHSTTV